MCKLRCFKIFLTGKSLSAYLQLITLILNSFQSKQRLLFFFFLFFAKLRSFWLFVNRETFFSFAANLANYSCILLKTTFLLSSCFLFFFQLHSSTNLSLFVFILILIFFILFFVLKLHRALNIFALASSLIKLL